MCLIIIHYNTKIVIITLIYNENDKQICNDVKCLYFCLKNKQIIIFTTYQYKTTIMIHNDNQI